MITLSLQGLVTDEVPLHPIFNRTGNVWHIFLPDLQSNLLYGYRVDSPFVLGEGACYDSRQILVDPYAKVKLGTLSSFIQTTSSNWSLNPVNRECLTGCGLVGSDQSGNLWNIGGRQQLLASNGWYGPRSPWRGTTCARWYDEVTYLVFNWKCMSIKQIKI